MGEVVEAEHAGWVAAGEMRGGGEACAGEALEVGDGAVHGEDRAGEGLEAVGEVGCELAAAVGDGDFEFAEHVVAVGLAGGGDAVGDEDGTIFALGSEPEADELGGDMDAVADEFRVETVGVEDDACDAGLAMVERAHGVEGVGRAVCAGVDGGAGLLGSGVGVADADMCA